MEHRLISWPAVRAQLANLLDTAERDGPAGARRWLQARGLRWLQPEQDA
jgi:hypothetical protein